VSQFQFFLTSFYFRSYFTNQSSSGTNNTTPTSSGVIYLSGAFAGSLNALVVSPVEFVRNRQIVQPKQV